ncbi:RNA polymerase sigma factor [Neorhodopirellula lusitana]|uniref:RNA polymerase sigma factor n=1 Tax=Neorhodopirellula lusitana TaxID=445327 RepID=UPI00384EAA64
MTPDQRPENLEGLTSDDIYDRWIRPIESRLAATAYRVLRSDSQAADALQNAMIRIWKNRRTLTTHANPTAWMLRIVLNATYEQLRRRRDRTNDIESVAALDTVDDALSYDESRSRVLSELASLSPQQAEAVMLRLVEELSYQEVADALDCSLATARVHVNRGREKLRSRLSDLDPANQGAER